MQIPHRAFCIWKGMAIFMKNAFQSIGKAAVYFFVYFLIQILVSVVFSAGLSVKMTMEKIDAGEVIDTTEMVELLNTAIMESAMLMTLIAGILVLFVFWLVFLIRKKKFTNEVCIRPIPAKAILPIAIMAGSFNILTSVIISMFPWPEGWMDSYAASSSAIDNSLTAWLTAVVMAPVLEEIVFRGLVYTRLKKGLPQMMAAIMTSLIFGIAHGTIIWAIYTFIFGMVLIWIFEKFGSLTASILLHLSYNLSGMALALIPEEAGFLILVLFGVSIWTAKEAYKRISQISAEDNYDFETLDLEIEQEMEDSNKI